MKDNKYTEDIDFSSLLVDEKSYTKMLSKSLFDAYDYGPESHRIINGKICWNQKQLRTTLKKLYFY